MVFNYLSIYGGNLNTSGSVMIVPVKSSQILSQILYNLTFSTVCVAGCNLDQSTSLHLLTNTIVVVTHTLGLGPSRG